MNKDKVFFKQQRKEVVRVPHFHYVALNTIPPISGDRFGVPYGLIS